MLGGGKKERRNYFSCYRKYVVPKQSARCKGKYHLCLLVCTAARACIQFHGSMLSAKADCRSAHSYDLGL